MDFAFHHRGEKATNAGDILSTDGLSFYFLTVRPIKSLRPTQGRVLMSDVVVRDGEIGNKKLIL